MALPLAPIGGNVVELFPHLAGLPLMVSRDLHLRVGVKRISHEAVRPEREPQHISGSPDAEPHPLRSVVNHFASVPAPSNFRFGPFVLFALAYFSAETPARHFLG